MDTVESKAVKIFNSWKCDYEISGMKPDLWIHEMRKKTSLNLRYAVSSYWVDVYELIYFMISQNDKRLTIYP